jgi:hypothetical protein
MWLTCGVVELHWTGSILAISSYQQREVWAYLTTFLAKGFTNFAQLTSIGFRCFMTIAKTPE